MSSSSKNLCIQEGPQLKDIWSSREVLHYKVCTWHWKWYKNLSIMSNPTRILGKELNIPARETTESDIRMKVICTKATVHIVQTSKFAAAAVAQQAAASTPVITRYCMYEIWFEKHYSTCVHQCSVLNQKQPGHKGAHPQELFIFRAFRHRYCCPSKL